MEQLNPRARRDAFGSKINRTHSKSIATVIPWLSIMLGSMAPWLPILAPAPVLPPLGFLMMLSWRQLRPGLLPAWAGLPLGLFDDLFSGQPLGSGVLLFSLGLIAVDLVEIRFPWRSFWLDWLTTAVEVTVYLLVAAIISGARIASIQPALILAPLLLSIVLFPIIGRMVSLLDRLRLMRLFRLN